MTPDRLAHIGGALFGEHWQTALARALELGPNGARRIREYAAGARRVPPALAARLEAMLAAEAVLPPRFVAGPADNGRDYVVSLMAPRFTARIAEAQGGAAIWPDEDARGQAPVYTGHDFLLVELKPAGDPPAHLVEAVQAAGDFVDALRAEDDADEDLRGRVPPRGPA